jgi:hypothetical protein
VGLGFVDNLSGFYCVAEDLKMSRRISYAATVLILAILTTGVGGKAWSQTTELIQLFETAARPIGTLARDNEGNLYGVTEESQTGGGSIWKLTPDADRKWTLTILHSFLYDGTEGAVPQGGLIIDHFGNLYGTASQGGTSDACNSILNFPGCGVVFELARSANGSWAYRVIHNFSFSDGAYPLGALLLDEAGSLYGTTEYGGYESCYGGCGVVFKLARNCDGTWSETVINGFDRVNGAYPFANVIFDRAGNLYGTTSGGSGVGCPSDSGCGVVFQLRRKSEETWTENVLYRFTGGSDGAYSTAGLTVDAEGRLYGTTTEGGQGHCSPDYVGGCGVVFKLRRKNDETWTYQVIHAFVPGSTGAVTKAPGGFFPAVGVTFDSAGRLYGSALEGGLDDFGVVFELIPTGSGWREKVLHTFMGRAEFPQSPILIDPAGHLFGTTLNGLDNYGTVFEITP